jgi:ERCC4-type nuclease
MREGCAVSESTFDFPVLRDALANLSSVVVAIIDTREQKPLPFHRLKTVRKTLYCGDYALDNAPWAAAIERKSIEDAVGCCMGENRARFEKELMRLHGCSFRRLLIVGSRGDIEQQRYHSRISPKSVLNTLSCFEVRYQVPVVFCETPEIAGRQTESWLFWVAREQILTAKYLLRGAAQQQNGEEVPNGQP